MVIEVGILNGSGLAMWCDLFSRSRIIGLDLHLQNFYSNLKNLQGLGAFQGTAPEVYRFDQLDPIQSQSILSSFLQDTKVDIVIDDGLHSIPSIKNTFSLLNPYLSDRSVYIIEDRADTFDVMQPDHPYLHWHQRGNLTIATRRG